MPISAATRRAPATARSSPGTTSRPRSIWASASAVPSSSRRGRSTTTAPPPLRAAARTDRIASGGIVTASPRSQLRKRSPCSEGSDSSSARPATRPLDVAKSGHRRPSAPSPPSRTSRPPPSGSPSTSTARLPARAAPTASAQARVEAPAPPRPPITPTVSAGRPAPSAASAIRSTSQLSASGSRRTQSAPISTARRQAPGSISSPATSRTPRRRAAPRQDAAASSPTRTRGAVSHSARCSGSVWCTAGWAPAAAHNRSRSSSRSPSAVMISGPARRSSSAGRRSSVMDRAIAVTPLSRTSCRGAAAAHRPGRAGHEGAQGVPGRSPPRLAGRRCGRPGPAETGDSRRAPSGSRNHRAGDSEMKWILVKNCGQRRACE